MLNRIIAATAALFLSLLGLSLMSTSAQADEGKTTCTTEKTGWVTTAPEDDSWKLVDERTVTDEEAYDVTVVDSEAVPAQHYSLKGNSGIEKDEVPVFPADYWQANTSQEPHLNNPNVTWVDEVGSGLHYTSHDNNGYGEGKRDWFYYQLAVEEVTHVEHHEAVTHTEYKFEREVCVYTHTPHEPQCSEGQPCWDCSTMGNGKCGAPDKPDATVPPSAKKELPHTGAPSTGLLALIGTSLIGAGSLLYRKFA